MSTEYDNEAASRRFLDRMFPDQRQRQDVACMLEGVDGDYSTSEVLGGLLQVDKARFNQSLVDSKRCDDSLFPLIDDLHFKDEIVGIAGRYIESPRLHSKPLSLFLLLATLDTELYPLKRDVHQPLEVLARSTENTQIKLAVFSQSGFGRGSNWFASLLLLALATAAFFIEWNWIGALLVALLLWQCLSVFSISRRVKKASNLVEANLTKALRSLQLIRGEVATGAFDADAMTQRIKRAEEEGLYLPSVAYPLLQLSAPRRC